MPAISARGDMMFTAFVGSRAYGWMESHYILGAADLPAALLDLKELSLWRTPLLGGGVVLTGLRVSDINILRDSQVEKGPEPGFVMIREDGPPPDVNLITRTALEAPRGSLLHNDAVFQAANRPDQRFDMYCDFPWSGYLLRMEAGANYTQRRSLILRGNPDLLQTTSVDRIAGTGNNNGPAAQWNQQLDAYILALTNGGFGFRAKPQAPVRGDTTTNRNIDDIAVDSVGNVLFKAGAGAPTLAVGNKIRIRDTRLRTSEGLPVFSLNREWTIATINDPATGNFTVYNARLEPSFAPFTVERSGSFYNVGAAIVVPYAKVIERRWASRKTGLPFDRPRGRARNKIRRFDYVVA